MTLVARTVATLRFFGDDLEPEAVSRLLGRPPSAGGRKGEAIKSEKTGRERTLRTGSWRLEVGDREPGDLDGQIDEIVSQLSKDVSHWRGLARYQPDLFVGVFLNQPNEMIELSAKSILLLAERGIGVTFDIYDPTPKFSNIQIIDRADNATFSIFQASSEEFARLFPNSQDMEFAEDFVERVGEVEAEKVFDALWGRPILKRDAKGIHGTLYFNYATKRSALPASKREVDYDDSAINPAQRKLFAQWR